MKTFRNIFTAVTLLALSTPAFSDGCVLRQSTARDWSIGPFVDATDGATAQTALTIANTDVRLKKNGAAYANKNSGGGTHEEDGWYEIALNATDTNTVGSLQIQVTMAGALQVWESCLVVEEAVYDNFYAAASAGPLTAAQVNAQADTALTDYDGPTSTEMIERTLTSGGYFDPAVDTVANVTTVATNTDMRGTDSALLASAAPANFGDLSITASTGRVDVGAWLGVVPSPLEDSTDFRDAVMQYALDNGVTFESAVCYMMAVMLGQSDYTAGTPDNAFSDPTGTDVRVTVTYGTGGNLNDRTVVALSNTNCGSN